MEAETLNAWPLLLIPFAVGGAIGFVSGYAHAIRRFEKMIRGGRAPIR